MVSRGLLLTIIGLALFGSQAQAQRPPLAKTVPFTETLHGDTISDPYRWMEKGGPEYDAWLKAQERYARAQLSALPKHAALLKAISERSGAMDARYAVQSHGGMLFNMRRPAGAQQPMLYLRGSDGVEHVLFDAAYLDGSGGGRHAIDYWEASPDGKYVYVGVSTDGSELSTLRVIEVATRKVLPESFALSMFNHDASEIAGGPYPQWAPDSSGFFYKRRAKGAVPGAQDFFLNGRVLYHKVGADPRTDVLIAEAGKNSKLALPANASFAVIAQPGSRFALLLSKIGVENSMRVDVATLESAVTSSGAWRTIANAADRIEGVALSGEDLYLLRRDRPRGRIVKTSANSPSLARAQELVPEGDAVIQRLLPAQDGVYVLERAASGHRVRRLNRDGSVTQIALPFDGTSFYQFASPQADGMLLSLENYVTPRVHLRSQADRFIDAGLPSHVPLRTDAYSFESVLAKSRDGVHVPLDIVRRRDAPRDGKRPVLLEAYGAYGISLDAFFSPRLFAFLDQGGVLAAAHVRGGGELGDEWRKAGFQATKANTWRDAIDCAQWLIDAGWTGPRRITVWGASAGGIMAGRAITERPDLWAGGVASVGAMNALRLEFTPGGEMNTVEFGSVKTIAGYRALKAMDAYHAIRDGVAYPPMLLTAGVTDQRVVTWQPAKFAARMQATSTGGPVFFKVLTDEGHGLGSTRSQIDEDMADISAFALWAAEASTDERPPPPH